MTDIDLRALIRDILTRPWSGHSDWYVSPRWALFYRLKAMLCCLLNRLPPDDANIYDHVHVVYTDGGLYFGGEYTVHWFSAVVVGYGIRTDNRRSNLRVATTQENCRNQCKPKHNTSGYKGVVFLRGKWQAQVKHNRKNVYVGLFNTALEAARAYDEKAKELFGEFAQLNFE